MNRYKDWQDQAERDLEKAGQLTAQRKEVEAVYLFGSLARGDYTGFSDADILIILHDRGLNPIESIRTYIPIAIFPRE